MVDDAPATCSLDTTSLKQRLAVIADIGADSLTSRGTEGNRHLLRFQASATTRRRLEEIVAAEAECCSFLDLSLKKEGEELILSIAAPMNAQALANGLAEAFARTSATSRT